MIPADSTNPLSSADQEALRRALGNLENQGFAAQLADGSVRVRRATQAELAALARASERKQRRYEPRENDRLEVLRPAERRRA